MIKDLNEQFKIALRFLIIIMVLTGLIYPSFVSLMAMGLFPWQSQGSLLKHQGKIIGSLQIGQYFSEEKYFWSRPSATARFPYDAEHSSGSNVSISSPRFLLQLQSRVAALHRADPQQSTLIPVDLVTTSASGLDPDISVAAAYYQIPRIARARHLSESALKNLVERHVHRRVLGILGEPRVQVLKLNILLDRVIEERP
jgi:K+-transporting ATPase ATPase C chain